MLKRNRPIRVLSHLLVFAISMMQITAISAAVEDSAKVGSAPHCLTKHTHSMNHADIVSADTSPCPHMQALAEQADCCSSGDCADKSCIAGSHLVSSAVFFLQTRLSNSAFSKSKIEIHNQLHAGINSASVFRPPR